MDILLTNDDGYDSYGLHALADALEPLGDVTIVAPVSDQSATGRTHSSEVKIVERERGYTVAGTPVDCILAGTEIFTSDPDVVVAGCNRGANVGGHTLARSGTVSAAVEATFMGIPAIAVSLYIPESHWPLESDDPDFYPEAKRAARYLVETTIPSSIYENGGYLNVNVPLPTETPADLIVTKPSTYYDYSIERERDTVRIVDKTWGEMEKGTVELASNSDRAVVMDDNISVTPLRAPHQTVNGETLERILTSQIPEQQ